MWPRNLRDFAWSTRMMITTSAIPRTTSHTMYFWIPPRPSGSLIRAVPTNTARWFASAVEETVSGIASTVPRSTPAGDCTRNWMLDSASGARVTLAASTATTGRTATARLTFVDISMMSSTHHPPEVGMMLDVALKRNWSVETPGGKYEFRFTLTVLQLRSFP